MHCMRIYSPRIIYTKLLKMHIGASRRSLSSDEKTHNCDNAKVNTNRPIYIPEEVSLDDPPTTCCMSGCHNCVYIAWAEALSKKMSSGDPVIARKVLENIEDPCMRAFLQMELRSLGLM